MLAHSLSQSPCGWFTFIFSRAATKALTAASDSSNNVTGRRLRNRGAAAPPSRERAQPDVSIAAAVGGTGRDGLKSTPLVICPIRPCRCSRHRLGESLITLRRLGLGLG